MKDYHFKGMVWCSLARPPVSMFDNLYICIFVFISEATGVMGRTETNIKRKEPALKNSRQNSSQYTNKEFVLFLELSCKYVLSIIDDVAHFHSLIK